MRGALRVAIALLPLCLAPLLVHLIGDGVIDLGGGEKDLVWVLPWTLWSLLFAIASLVLWRRGWPLSRATSWAAIAGVAGVLLAALALAATGQLGVGGLF
jgi:hypothetical protein